MSVNYSVITLAAQFLVITLLLCLTTVYQLNKFTVKILLLFLQIYTTFCHRNRTQERGLNFNRHTWYRPGARGFELFSGMHARPKKCPQETG